LENVSAFVVTEQVPDGSKHVPRNAPRHVVERLHVPPPVSASVPLPCPLSVVEVLLFDEEQPTKNATQTKSRVFRMRYRYHGSRKIRRGNTMAR